MVKRHSDRTGTGGTAFVSMIVNLDMKWIYRPQDHPGTDYGVDAHIEVTDEEGVETGRQVAAQVKATSAKRSTPALSTGRAIAM